MEKVKIGIVGINSPNFYAKEYNVFEKSLEWLNSVKEKENFETVIFDMIENKDDGDRARKFFERENVDFLFLQNTAFSMGDFIYSFKNVEFPLGIWSVREPAVSTDIKLNSLVSANLYASIIKRNLKDSIKYKWFYGNSEEKIFQERFLVTLQALRGLKALKTRKVGLIGKAAPSFFNLNVDIAEYAKNAGLKNYQHLSFDHVIKKSEKILGKDIDKTVRSMNKNNNVNVSDENLYSSAKVYLALKETAREKELDSIGISCWPDFQDHFGIVPCVALSMLGDIDEIPVDCEGDFGGAVTMQLLYSMTGNIPAVMDFAHLSLEDNLLLLWHCGIGTRSLSKDDKPEIINHPMMNRKLPKNKHMGLSYNFQFKKCDVTISRVTDFGKSLFAISGKTAEGKDSGFVGTRGYIKSMKFRENKINVTDLLNTIMKEGIEHHLIVCEGSCDLGLIELCHYQNLNIVEINKYTKYA
ncbi:MAG TPA: hypothetical protein QF753_05705 [Victivallales bacterium]|nr:hypothetical protein [Victivallales bacterium]